MIPNVYSASGGKLIWLLNVLDDNRTSIGIEYYDLQTHNVVQINTCYRFSVFCLISANYKIPFFKMLFDTFGESIEMIGDSNLRLECYPHTLLDCLLQVNHSERVIQYDLSIIKCISLKSCKRILDFLKSNLKPYYECVDSLEASYMLMMQLFLDANTIQHEHPYNDTKTIVSFRLKFLQSKISSQFDVGSKMSHFDPTRIFVTNGLYIFNAETLRLILFSTDTSELYKLLPMVSFHLEAVTDNLTDIPSGNSENERIVSYVLFVTHAQNAIICVNYLRFLLVDSMEKEIGSTKWWKECDKLLSEKYQKQFLGNYRELHIWVESYDNEIQLLESFIQLYSQGQLLNAMVNNSKAKHFFTGYNIIKYDLPLLLRRFKWHQMHQQVEDHVTYDTSSLGNCSESIIKFHKYAYIVDTFRVFQQQHLATNLSLNSLTTTYLPDAAKIHLNPVLIRIYYLLRNVRDTKFLQEIAKNAMDNSESDFSVSLRKLPQQIQNSLPSMELGIYGFDQFLAYNVANCESVVDLWNKFNYSLLFSLITQIYPCNLEKALQANSATRIKIAFDYIAIKYRQILSANDFTNIGTRKLRYLFHSRVNESLLYKSTQMTNSSHINFEEINEIEIDESRYRRNVNQFLVESYTRCPIVDRVCYKSTKRKYPGAAVLVFPGVYSNTVQLDIVSQYPNILMGKRLFLDAVDICSAGSLQRILSDSTLRENFSSWLRTDCIQIFLAEENCNANFSAYLKNFSFQSDENNATLDIVGQLVNIEILMKLSPEIPLLLYCPDSQCFLNNFIGHLLNLRKSLQNKICENETRDILDATQKFIKSMVNSVCGQFGNVYIPVAAMISLLGRKILIFASKMVPVIILQILMQHLKIWHWLQVDDVENFDNELLVAEKFNSRLVDGLATATGREKFRRTCNLMRSHFSNSMSENANGTLTEAIFNETNISLLRLRCLMDGQTSVRLLDKTRKQLQQLLIDNGHQNENYIQDIFDSLPSVIKNCVFDCDTDGLHFANTFEIDTKLILELLNQEIVQAFQLENIIFTDKQFDHVFALAKKKYTTFKCPTGQVNHLEDKEYVIYIDDCAVQHIGYEKNASPIFKYLCNFIAVLCMLIHQGKTLRLYKFREIIWSVFNYLENLSPDQLYIRVKLNRLKLDSARRFTDKYIRMNSGVLRAVYVVKKSTFAEQSSSSSTKRLEQLVLLDDYIYSVKQQKSSKNKKMKLHYGFFLRTFGKIWYQQYCLSTTTDNNCDKELKNSSTMSIIHQYFDDWFSRSPQSRLVDDLDNFLSNRFIVINRPLIF